MKKCSTQDRNYCQANISAPPWTERFFQLAELVIDCAAPPCAPCRYVRNKAHMVAYIYIFAENHGINRVAFFSLYVVKALHLPCCLSLRKWKSESEGESLCVREWARVFASTRMSRISTRSNTPAAPFRLAHAQRLVAILRKIRFPVVWKFFSRGDSTSWSELVVGWHNAYAFLSWSESVQWCIPR